MCSPNFERRSRKQNTSYLRASSPLHYGTGDEVIHADDVPVTDLSEADDIPLDLDIRVVDEALSVENTGGNSGLSIQEKRFSITPIRTKKNSITSYRGGSRSRLDRRTITKSSKQNQRSGTPARRPAMDTGISVMRWMLCSLSAHPYR